MQNKIRVVNTLRNFIYSSKNSVKYGGSSSPEICNGKSLTVIGNDLIAVTFYHEFKHLDGIIFTDKLNP